MLSDWFDKPQFRPRVQGGHQPEPGQRPPLPQGGGTAAKPPHAAGAAEGAREIIAFLQGAGYGDWKAIKVAESDTRVWRLAHLAGILMSADVAAGARCFDVSMWIDRAEDLLAEAGRRVSGEPR